MTPIAPDFRLMVDTEIYVELGKFVWWVLVDGVVVVEGLSGVEMGTRRGIFQ
jgi:hypothetical protein